eukprot:Pgem_evm5s14806
MATSSLRNNQLRFTSDGLTINSIMKSEANKFTFEGDSAASVILANVATPVDGLDVANKNYVDAAASGLDWKNAVDVATTVNGDFNTAFAAGQVVDGHTLIAGERILIKDQDDGLLNGIHVVQATGAPIRADDHIVGSDVHGDAVFILNGTENQGRAFVCNNEHGSDTLGTDPLTFTQFFSGTVYQGSDGVTISSDQVTVDSTVLRTTGDQTASGVKTFSGEAVMSAGLKTGADNVGLTVGAGDDLNIQHDGTDSKITNNTGDIVIDNTSATGEIKNVLGTDDANTQFSITNDSGTNLLVVDGTGAITVNSNITGLSDPTSDSHAANKSYVDSSISNLTNSNFAKQPVQYAAIGNKTLSSDLNSGNTINSSHNLSDGDRILLFSQNSGMENGIYVVQPTGPAIRSDDFALGSSVGGVTVVVQKGKFAEKMYVVNNDKTDDLVGTASLTISEFAAEHHYWKDPVQFALDSNQDLTTALYPGAVIGSNSLSLGDRVLLMNQTSANEQGVYVIGATATDIERAEDFELAKSVGSAIIAVQKGTYKNRMFQVTNDKGVDVVGTNDLMFEEFAPAPHDMWKDAVRVATRSNVILSSGMQNGVVLETVTLIEGDRVLLLGQSVSSENGIYSIKTTSPPDRADDLATGSNASGMVVAVRQGTYAETAFICTNDSSSATVGTDGLTFQKLGAIPSGSANTLQFNDGDEGFSALEKFTVDGDNLKVDNTAKIIFQNDGCDISGNGAIMYLNSSNFRFTAGSHGEIENKLGGSTVDDKFVIKDSGDVQRFSVDGAGLVTASNRITGVSNPTAASDAINKSYLEEQMFSTSWKEPVRLVVTTNVLMEEILKDGAEIESTVLNQNDFVYLKSQDDSTENGIYKITATGHTKIGDVAVETSANKVVISELGANESVDGHSLSYNSYVTLENQNTSSENGLYKITYNDPEYEGIVNKRFSSTIQLESDIKSGKTVESVVLAVDDYVFLNAQSSAEDGVYKITNHVPTKLHDIVGSFSSNQQLESDMQASKSVDGITVNNGDIVKLAAQDTTSDNGLFEITALDPIKQPSTVVEPAGNVLLYSDISDSKTHDGHVMATNQYIHVNAQTLTSDNDLYKVTTHDPERITIATYADTNVLLTSDLTNGSTVESVVMATGDLVNVNSQSVTSENKLFKITASDPEEQSTEATVDTQTLVYSDVAAGQHSIQDSRVYIGAQNTPSENGIYNISEHAPIFDYNPTVVASTNQAILPDIRVGHTFQSVTPSNNSYLYLNSQNTGSQNGVYQVTNSSILPTKQTNIALITTTNIVPFSELTPGNSIGGTVLSIGDYVWLTNQTDSGNNGLWYLQPSPQWHQHKGYDNLYIVSSNFDVAASIPWTTSTVIPTDSGNITVNMSNKDIFKFEGQNDQSENGVYWFYDYSWITEKYNYKPIDAESNAPINIDGDLRLGQTIESYTLQAGDYVLTTGQTSFDNYTVFEVSTNSAWRATIKYTVNPITINADLQGLTTGAEVNSHTLAENDTVLLTNQNDTSENNLIYTIAAANTTPALTETLDKTLTLQNYDIQNGGLNVDDVYTVHTFASNELVYLSNQTDTAQNGLYNITSNNPTQDTVIVTTTANINISADLTNNNTVETVILATDDLVNVTSQSSSADNDVYKVTAFNPVREVTNYKATGNVIVESDIQASKTVESVTLAIDDIVNIASQSENSENDPYKVTAHNPVRQTYRVASTTNLDLYSEIRAGQTIETVSLLSEDVIYLASQSDNTQDGIYTIKSGNPTSDSLASSWAGIITTNIEHINGEFNAGTQVPGTSYTPVVGDYWYLGSQNESVQNGFYNQQGIATISAQNITGEENVAHIYTTNVTSPATALFNGENPDSNYSLITGDYVILMSQTTTSENGLYLVAASSATQTYARTIKYAETTQHRHFVSELSVYNPNDGGNGGYSNNQLVLLSGQTDITQNGVYTVKNYNPIRVTNNWRLKTTANVLINGALAIGQVIESQTLVANDVIYVKSQSSANENSLYTINSDPNGLPTSTSFALTTTSNVDIFSEFAEGGSIDTGSYTLNLSDKIVLANQNDSAQNGLYTMPGVSGNTAPSFTPFALTTTANVILQSDLTALTTLESTSLNVNDKVAVVSQDNVNLNGIYTINNNAAPTHKAIDFSFSSNKNLESALTIGKNVGSPIHTIAQGDKIAITNNVHVEENGIYTIGAGSALTFEPFVLKTTVNITNLFHGLSVGKVLNSHTLAADDIVLLKNQNTQSESGTWKVKALVDYATQETAFVTDKTTTTNVPSLFSDIRVNKVVDSITIADGNHLLLLNQTDTSQNGIWKSESSGITHVNAFTAIATTTSNNISVIYNPLSANQLISSHTLTNLDKVILTGQSNNTQNGVYTINDDNPTLTEQFTAVLTTTSSLTNVLPDLRVGNIVDSHTVVAGDKYVVAGNGSADNGYYTFTDDTTALTKDIAFTLAKFVDTINVENLQGDLVVNDVIETHTLLQNEYVLLKGQVVPSQNGFYKIRSSSPEHITDTIVLTTTANVDIDKLIEGEIYGSKTLAEGDRVLLIGQSDGIQNGLYIIPASSSTNSIPPRSSDLAIGMTALGLAVLDRETDKIYVCHNDDDGIVGTHSLSFGTTTDNFVGLTGNESVAGQKTFTNAMIISDSTAATSVSTGSLIISGGVGISGSVFATEFVSVSDATLKVSINPLDDSLAKIKKINGYNYYWKDTDRFGEDLQTGLLAQEVLETDLRDIVKHGDHLSVNYTALIPHLVESIKTLSNKVDDLEAL